MLLFINNLLSKLSAKLRLPLLYMAALLTAFSISLNAYAVESLTYIHTDAAGSPVAATDRTGAVSWRQNYRPYGDRLQQQDQGTHKQWFTGKSHDDSTGLSYFGARYYDPSIGRFTGMDSVRYTENNVHSFNRYAYGNNNPYKYNDPDGRIPLLLLAVPQAVSVLTPVAYAIGTRIALSGAYRFGMAWAAGEVGLATTGLTIGTGVAVTVAKGAAKGAATELVTVGRWMSPTEYGLMSGSGRLVESQLTVTNLALPANSAAYANAVSGSVYAEFQIAKDSLNAVGNGWAKVFGPSSIFAEKLGITEMPAIFNPAIKAVKP